MCGFEQLELGRSAFGQVVINEDGREKNGPYREDRREPSGPGQPQRDGSRPEKT